MWRVVFCLAVLGGAEVQAGAWARGQGNLFFSFSQSFAIGPDSAMDTTSAYLEYGVRPRLTFGAKLDQFALGGRTTEAFLRYNLSGNDARWQVALGAGAARIEAPGLPTDTAPFALALVGRGFGTPWGNGWAEAEFKRTQRLSNGDVWRNVDLTLGLSPTDRTHVILQTRVYSDDDTTLTTVAPAYVRRFGDRFRAKIGATVETGDTRAIGIELGGWIDF